MRLAYGWKFSRRRMQWTFYVRGKTVLRVSDHYAEILRAIPPRQRPF